MRSSHSDLYVDGQGRQYRRMTLAQRTQLRRKYIANVPGWRRAPVGFLVSILFVVAITLFDIYYRTLLGRSLFASSLYILSIVVVALFWGVGPAIVDLILSTCVLDYYFVEPESRIPFTSWNSLLEMGPFIVSGLIITLITVQRERARLQALAAEQDAQAYLEELEESNYKLEDANQMKDRFISIASHELKTPVTTIRGQAQLMLRRISKQKANTLDGVETALERINAQTGRLTVLIDDLLEASSVRMGMVTLNLRPCDIRDVCRTVVDEQVFLTDRTIHLSMPDQPVMIKIDQDRISQVVTNLVSNAAKYSPETEAIDVTVTQEDSNVKISVRDYGCGVKKEYQERIFETFYRTPDAQSSPKHGLGLGLSISKNIVERHGGKIWCESTGEKGSVFVVVLPMSAQDNTADG